MKNKFNDVNQENIISIYNYGSVVYGTNTDDSDTDIILVVKDKTQEVLNLVESVKNPSEHKLNIDIQVYTGEEFEEKIKTHEISVLECLFLSKDNIILNNKDWIFNLELPILRKSISEKASNSWVKAKKKFIIEKDYDPYIGLKSAWHSFRILNFGTQIATHGKIINYSEMNDLFSKIMECKSWEELNEKFKKLHNETSSKFKLVAPKEVVIEKKSNLNFK